MGKKLPAKVSFLIHKAPPENRQEGIIVIGVEKKQYKKIQNPINEVKIIGSRLEFEPASSASKPCCPTHSAMGTIRISDKCQQMMRIYAPTEIRN